jgi:hypothetical protein
MKKTLLLITLVVVCFSCNNKGTNKTNEGCQTIEDSIKQLSLIRQQDSINRERIFEAKGDTIFASILYGMNRIEAEKNIRTFEKALKHPYPEFDGFVFGTIHFMNIRLYDYEDFKPNNPDPYENSYLWKGKLSCIEWHSYKLYARKLIKIENVLNKFIAYFESRYKKPNIKKVQSSEWFVYNNNTFLFFDSVVAKWETNKRLIEISIEWNKWPKTAEEVEKEIGYEFNINVRFSDKVKISEIIEYRDSINEIKLKEEKERQLKDSLKSINSL